MEEEAQPFLASSVDDHRDGPSSITPERVIDNDPLAFAVDDIAPREFPDASAEEEARFEALSLVPWRKRPSISWLLPFVFVLAVVLGMSSTPLEYLLIKIVCKDYFRGQGKFLTSGSDPSWDDMRDECSIPPVVALAALVTSKMVSLKSITGVFTIGFYTTLSDRIGRKLLMYLTLIPAVFSQLFIVYMAQPSTQVGLGYLYIEAFLSGFFGAGMLLEPALNAYIADSTSRDRRPVVIGYALVSFSLGLISGSALGVFYIHWTGENSSVLIVSASTFALLAVYCVFVPESLPTLTQRRFKSEIIDAKEIPSFLIKLKGIVMKTLDPLLLFFPGRIDESATASKPPRRYTLFLIVCANAMLNFALNGLTTVFIPYAKLVLHWESTDVLFFSSVMGAVTLLIYMAIFPLLQMLYRRFVLPGQSKGPEIHNQGERSPLMAGQGVHDRPKVNSIDSNMKDMRFFLFGAVLYVIGYAIMIKNEQAMVLFFAMSIHALASVGSPSFTSLLTSYVPTHQTGMALGGICVLNAIISALSSLLYGWIFSQTSASMPSAIYVTSTALSLLAVVVVLVTSRTF